MVPSRSTVRIVRSIVFRGSTSQLTTLTKTLHITCTKTHRPTPGSAQCSARVWQQGLKLIASRRSWPAVGVLWVRNPPHKSRKRGTFRLLRVHGDESLLVGAYASLARSLRCVVHVGHPDRYRILFPNAVAQSAAA
eukprot:1682147-Prymnesium_polylepis.2